MLNELRMKRIRMQNGDEKKITSERGNNDTIHKLGVFIRLFFRDFFYRQIYFIFCFRFMEFIQIRFIFFFFFFW